MTWEEFLNALLEEEQILVLREALKVNAKVYFYGAGLGKSVVVDVLRSFGYQASEPGMCTGKNVGAFSVPEHKDYVCFEVKEKALEKLNICLNEQLKSQKKEFINWVHGEDIKTFSTQELIEELKTRQGVEEVSTGLYKDYKLIQKYLGENKNIKADMVLIVKDLKAI